MDNKLNKKNLEIALEKIGQKSVDFLKFLLIDNDKVATGDLVRSLDYDILEATNGLTLEILADKHFKYVNEGRKKNSKPPPIKAILPWIKIRNVNFKGKTSEQTAYAIANGIAKNGIKPLYMKGKLIKELNKNITSIITSATKEDIQEMLNKIYKLT